MEKAKMAANKYTWIFLLQCRHEQKAKMAASKYALIFTRLQINANKYIRVKADFD